MLTETEKKHVIYSLKTGLSYWETAQDLILWRNHFVMKHLCEEMKALIKEEK